MTVDPKALADGLALLSPIVAKRVNFPVLLDADSIPNQLWLRAHSDTAYMYVAVTADVETSGRIVANAKTLQNTAKQITAKGMRLQAVEGRVVTRLEVSSGRYLGKLNTESAEGFEKLPGGQLALTVDSEHLCSVIERTNYCVSKDDSRYVLQGIELSGSGNGQATATSTDGHRLSLVRSESFFDADGCPENLLRGKVIIPGAGLNLVLSLIRGRKDGVQILMGSSWIRFAIGDDGVALRLIDGKFPDTASVIPASDANVLVVDRRAITEAIGRSLLVMKREDDGVTFTGGKGELRLHAVSADLGEFHETIDADFEVDNVTRKINPRFLLQALERMDSTRVRVAFNDSQLLPIVVSPVDDETHRAVIMPMKAA